MATYFIIHSETREVVRRSDSPFNVDPLVQPPAPFVQLVRVDDDALPVHDAATQKLVRAFEDDDVAGTRTFRWTVAQLTQDEIAAKATAAANEQARQQIKAAITALRSGTGTAAERLQRLERAVAYLLRGELQ